MDRFPRPKLTLESLIPPEFRYGKIALPDEIQSRSQLVIVKELPLLRVKEKLPSLA